MLRDAARAHAWVDPPGVPQPTLGRTSQLPHQLHLRYLSGSYSPPEAHARRVATPRRRRVGCRHEDDSATAALSRHLRRRRLVRIDLRLLRRRAGAAETGRLDLSRGRSRRATRGARRDGGEVGFLIRERWGGPAPAALCVPCEADGGRQSVARGMRDGAATRRPSKARSPNPAP